MTLDKEEVLMNFFLEKIVFMLFTAYDLPHKMVKA